jgi:hypothetical protein
MSVPSASNKHQENQAIDDLRIFRSSQNGLRLLLPISVLAAGRGGTISQAGGFIGLPLDGPTMTSDQCHDRARRCAAYADIAPLENLAQEFLELAARWRAMAVREDFLGQPGETPINP